MKIFKIYTDKKSIFNILKAFLFTQILLVIVNVTIYCVLGSTFHVFLIIESIICGAFMLMYLLSPLYIFLIKESEVVPGSKHIKKKLNEMFGVDATEEQIKELERVVLASRGLQIVNFNEMGNSYRIDPKKETTTEAE